MTFQSNFALFLAIAIGAFSGLMWLSFYHFALKIKQSAIRRILLLSKFGAVPLVLSLLILFELLELFSVEGQYEKIWAFVAFFSIPAILILVVAGRAIQRRWMK